MPFPEFSKVKERSETALLGKAFRGLRERFLEGGYPALGEYGCETLGVRPVYVAENRPEFAEWRERLKTESGLVIANHPGGIDVPAILKTLERKDVYFLAAGKNVQRLADVVGEEHLLETSADPGKVRALFRRIEDILQRGGLVFLFPTGGTDFNGKPIAFKSGFRALIRSLRPEQMVYAFQINTEDFHAAFPIAPSGFVLGSSALVKRAGLVRQHEPFPTVRINERYTTAQEWKDVLKESSPLEANERLAKRYLELFKEGDDRSQ